MELDEARDIVDSGADVIVARLRTLDAEAAFWRAEVDAERSRLCVACIVRASGRADADRAAAAVERVRKLCTDVQAGYTGTATAIDMAGLVLRTLDGREVE
jgi:hypothetical protein